MTKPVPGAMFALAFTALGLGGAAQAAAPAARSYPTDFASAAKTQPADPNWKKAYKPKSKRDFTGVWQAQGGIGWVPGIPPGPKQNPPLTPEYAAIFKMHQDNAAQGKPTGDITAACLPQGMPRIMTMTYPMEIMMNETQVNIFAEWEEQTRRIFLDGRPLDLDADPTFNGQTTGHWEGDVLVATTIGVHPDTNLESSGLPKSDQMIAYERIWLEDDQTLKDEITLVDSKALARPWTVTKTYKRGEPGFKVMQYVCLENNRNPVSSDGSIGVVLQNGAKP